MKQYLNRVAFRQTKGRALNILAKLYEQLPMLVEFRIMMILECRKKTIDKSKHNIQICGVFLGKGSLDLSLFKGQFTARVINLVK